MELDRHSELLWWLRVVLCADLCEEYYALLFLVIGIG